ncbi:hypothetical protein HDV05_000207 [Chytridiales sp. JEL 0842]|nr:hypothetical protein HDV05_000207 [Chytridiales sp. JEL 0842]
MVYDSASAIAYVAHKYSDAVFLLPSTLNSSARNLLIAWADHNDKNEQGKAVTVSNVVNPVATLVEDLTNATKLNKKALSLFVEASDFIRLVPALHHLAASTANSASSAVLHAAASSLSSVSQSLALLAHISPFVVLLSSEGSVQEAHDLALFSHKLVAPLSSAPVLLLRSVGSSDAYQHINARDGSKLSIASSNASSSSSAPLVSALESAFSTFKTLNTSPSYDFFELTKAPSVHPTHLLIVLGAAPRSVEEEVLASVSASIAVLRVRIYRPWSASHLLKAIPSSVTNIAVVNIGEYDQGTTTTLGYGQLFLDVAASFHSGLWDSSRPIPALREARVKLQHGQTLDRATVATLISTFRELNEQATGSHFEVVGESAVVGNGVTATVGIPTKDKVQETDSSAPYVTLLNQVFGERLQLSNVASESSVIEPESNSANGLSAEYGLGLHLAHIQQQHKFVELARSSLQSLPAAVQAALKAWLAADSSAADYAKLGAESLKALEEATKVPAVTALLDAGAAKFLKQGKASRWVLGGDRLAYDVGTSGVHHVISSKANVNILVLDTQPYTEKISATAVDRRKKDIGLYAMTYGGVYVASVALNANFAGVVRALQEADAFDGPSVVLAYSPRVQTVNGRVKGSGAGGVSATAALAVLKEIKLAVDEGYWPLYRWNPPSPTVVANLNGKDLPDPKFSLDSDKMRKELSDFLDRNKQLSLVAKAEPELALPASVEKELHQAVTTKIQESYATLLASLNTTPILVLYGSDGGNAASLAKRFAAEAKQRGLKPRVSVMDDIPAEEWVKHKHIVFFISTAGQGEFPGNSRESWKSLNTSAAVKELDWSSMQFSVMALGDSHYWPLPEDKHYFCKSGKDLDAKLEVIGASRLTNIGIGDDRGADGYMTGYKVWLAELWSALGVDSVDVGEVASSAPTDDAIKESSNFLRGTIAPGLEDESTGALAELDTKLTKFHGIYQQDDRDLREARGRAGLEPAFSFMVRVRVPAGVCSPEQWIAIDDVAGTHANGTIKITTRQAFQFHGILKRNLKKSIQDINHALMDTIAACGDVNRNVMCNPNPSSSRVHAQVLDFSRKFSTHLTPATGAYHEIWLDKKVVVTSEDVEPIYGKTYLPRKFKVAVAVPPHNDVDVQAHDLGYIAISEGDNLIGFNVTVGGGMGMTHGMKTTFPRIADVMGFCTVEQAIEVGEKVVTVQRDYGDRTNRKHARLKYTIEDRGIEWFKGEVEKRLGYKLQPAKPYKFESNGDRYGWSAGVNNTSSYTMFIQNGRVKDTVDRRMRTGLKEIAESLKGTAAEFRLTPNQHCIIANIPNALRPKVEQIMAKHDLENGKLSGLRLNSMACVALPTCTLAMAESERYLPDLVGKIEELLEEHGLRDDAITIRMTGCPNGCARPQIAEIAFIGKAPGTYNMYLGGGFTGERLNKIYKESITEPEILRELKPIIKDYAINRINGEHFGDFVIRKGWVKATLKGPDFHD